MENLEEYQFIDFDDKLLKDDAYNFILNACDEVEFFSEYQSCFVPSLSEVDNCSYPQLVDNLIEEREDSSWGMTGKIYKFKLNDYIKNILYNIGLTNFLYLDEDKKYLFQNTTLLKNNTVMYSSCTHEDFDEFDEAFRAELATICKEKLTNSDIYKELLNKNKSKAKEELEKDVQTLNDLCGYINKEIDAHIYVMPENSDITFSKYIDIANKSLSNSIVKELDNIHTFKDFISQEFIYTKEWQGKTINNPANQKDLIPLAQDIINECKYLYALLNFEK